MRTMRREKGWLAIKVDLEKVYDRLRWSFLLKTLHLIGLGDQLCSLIMQCVTSYSFQVCFNRERTESFRPQRGLRQDDPLFPYFLCYA